MKKAIGKSLTIHEKINLKSWNSKYLGFNRAYLPYLKILGHEGASSPRFYFIASKKTVFHFKF